MAYRDVRSALLIAFHYPPVGYSSGYQRVLKLAEYLPAHGWHPVVLAPHPRAYPVVDASPTAPAAESVEVYRTWAFDTGRHLALNGQYVGWLALPDRWVSWWLPSVYRGLRLIQRLHPAVIWSTYPIATAHLIALSLQRISGLPWVADLRDPMAMDGDPHDPRQRRVFRWIERQLMRRSAASTFTAPGTLSAYRARYPRVPAERFHLIPNGYDERDFADLQGAEWMPPATDRPLTLLHSGLLSLEYRDPTPLFEALARLRREGRVGPAQLRVVLRASGCEDALLPIVRRAGVEDMVSFRPWVSYREALDEMRRSDGLLLLQGRSCERQIPAKAYEYLRIGRPIVVLADSGSDTVDLMRKAGVESISPIDDRDAIAHALARFYRQVRVGTCTLPKPEVVRTFSREAMSAAFARLFDQVASAGG